MPETTLHIPERFPSQCLQLIGIEGCLGDWGCIPLHHVVFGNVEYHLAVSLPCYQLSQLTDRYIRLRMRHIISICPLAVEQEAQMAWAASTT